MQRPKGTIDIYGDYYKKLSYIKRIFDDLCDEYNIGYIETPVFENSEVFHRGVGEGTDIVTKETYDFKDRGDRDITLRPEGTAGVVRSVIENKMYTTLPLKLCYFGKMYRYERPQSGRLREFYQAGVEIFGDPSPLMDVNAISFMVKFYERIGLTGIKVKINSIGKLEDRIKYMEALREYFKPYIDGLCEDCKARYEKNTLRILDCKEDADKDCIKNAPKIDKYLSKESKEYLDKVLEGLKSLGIEYEIDDTLVRGLDYYNDTVFEVVFNDSSALGGGGRYDKLTSILDGVDLPAVGFAIGVNRVIQILDQEDIQVIDNDGLDAYIIPVSENENNYAIELMSSLRDNAFKVDMDFTGKKMAAKFKEADRYNAKFVIIVGEDEVKSNVLTVRDNLTKEETKVERDNLVDYLDVNI